ncbi:3'-5' exoribonuclease [Candidatus Pacearchaeota archaeon]|nr:3'-5' exoribonuclease [Candidatus Pacearchaeota archaeon]
MADKITRISLDLETSGLEIGKHVPLSIGAVKLDVPRDVIDDRNSFYVQLEWDSVTVDPAALKVNKLDIVNPPGSAGSFHNRSLPVEEGLHAFTAWLNATPWLDRTKIVAIGKNVGSFDLPMLKSIWSGPSFVRNWPFHYRSVDLNTLFFTLADIKGITFNEVQSRISEIAWKKQINLFGSNYPAKHHALADAWWNVYAREECIRWLFRCGVKI